MTTLHDPTNKSDFVALHLPFLRTNVGENCSRQTRVFLYRTRSAEMRSIFPQQQAPDNNAVYLMLEVLKKYIYIYIYTYIYYVYYAHIRLVISTNTKPCCQKWKCASRKYQNSLERSEISNRLLWNIFFKRPICVLCDLFVFVLFW